MDKFKYEPVFGDQSLFDDVGNDIVFVCFNPITTNYIGFGVGNLGALNTKEIDGMIAMRRIIKEPKRWTWEDKKAGVLPEVGSIVKFGKSEIEFLGVGEISNYWVCRYPSGVLAFRERGSIEPIETPEEKENRLREEFVRQVYKDSGFEKKLNMEGQRIAETAIIAAYDEMQRRNKESS